MTGSEKPWGKLRYRALRKADKGVVTRYLIDTSLAIPMPW